MKYTDLLAVEYCTHNHPAVIAELLLRCAERYKNCGIEMYFYDSSDNDDTKRVIDEYINKGYDNLIHVPLDSNTGVYEKVELIFAGVGQRREYKYVWPSKDRAYMDETKLREILKAAEKNYDVIYIAGGYIPRHEYDSATDFYLMHGAVSASLNVNIYNRQTLLADHKVTAEKKNYPLYLCAFGHMYVLFDELSRINKPSIKIIDINGGGVEFVPGASSTWIKDTLLVYKDCWIDVNDKLPDIYDPYKDSVIREGAGFRHILAHRDRLLELHDMGIITPETLPSALDRWERISDIPKIVVKDIAYGRYDMKYDLSQIKSDNKAVNILIEMAMYVKEGKLSRQQIPTDDISTVVLEEVMAKNYEEGKRNIVLGAVDSILCEIKGENIADDKVAKLLQQIIAYLL